MLSNSEFLVLLSQADNDRKRLGELLDIPENQLRFVRNVPSGNGLLDPGNSMIPFRNEFPQNTQLIGYYDQARRGRDGRWHGGMIHAGRWQGF